MTKKKKRLLIILIPVAIALIAAALYGLGQLGVLKPSAASSDEQVLKLIGAQAIWQNTMDDRIPQTAISDIMTRHMEQEGETPRKLLFIVYDGALATAAGLWTEKNPGNPIGSLAARGGAWLGFAGGAAPGDQSTSTSAGFASMFTGVWAQQNGIAENGDTLSPETRTIMYRLHMRNKRARFFFSWEPHQTVNYKLEAEEFPELYEYCGNDAGTFTSMLKGIEDGLDAVIGSLEYTDSAGHTTGYNLRSRYMKSLAKAEYDAKTLIAAAQERAEKHNEDWLIIIGSDHGGIGYGHGGTSMMESTTWFVANKKIF